jgi:GNAT superfamily N-acetyltransferase
MNIHIRPATAGDAGQIAQIQVDSYRTAYRSLLPAEYLAHFTIEEQKTDWESLISVETESVLLVAEIGLGNLVGYTYGQLKSYGAYDCEIVALHVREDAQNQGVGTTPFLGAIEVFAACSKHALFLWVLAGPPAVAFYKKFGGKLISIKPWVNNEHFGTSIDELTLGWLDTMPFLAHIPR